MRRSGGAAISGTGFGVGGRPGSNELPGGGRVRDRFAIAVGSEGLQEEHLASFFQETRTTADDPGPDRREVLQFHLERRAGAKTVVEQMAHGDIQNRCLIQISKHTSDRKSVGWIDEGCSTPLRKSSCLIMLVQPTPILSRRAARACTPQTARQRSMSANRPFCRRGFHTPI